MTEQAQSPTKKKGRSPSYPAINLETAIERVKRLWDQERQYPTAVETIVKHWGYRSFNGPASLTLAALKKFGLIEDEGTGAGRTATVSDLAVDILANPNDRARLKAIQQAALRPAVHQELWEKYGSNLPSDANLKWELTRQRSFTETGASEFIPVYRATIAYAQLADGASVTTQEAVEQDDPDEDDPPASGAKRRQGARRTRMSEADANVLTIPLVGGTAVMVEGAFPISETDWRQLMAVLDAMKPGLVRDPQTEDEDEDA